MCSQFERLPVYICITARTENCLYNKYIRGMSFPTFLYILLHQHTCLSFLLSNLKNDQLWIMIGLWKTSFVRKYQFNMLTFEGSREGGEGADLPPQSFSNQTIETFSTCSPITSVSLNVNLMTSSILIYVKLIMQIKVWIRLENRNFLKKIVLISSSALYS